MKILLAFVLLAMMLSGCHDNSEVLTCDDHGGVHSYKWYEEHLKITCDDGTIFTVDYI